MPDKSPQKPSGKKPGRSLKEKREVKRERKDNRPSLLSDSLSPKSKRH